MPSTAKVFRRSLLCHFQWWCSSFRKSRLPSAPLGARFTEVIGTPIQPKFLHRPLQPFPHKLQRICFVGRLATEKNVDRIIEAAAQFPHIEFVIGGDGPLREELQRAAKPLSHVRFVGWLSRDKLIDLLDQSSLLLLPSRIETFGSVALEAMARGRPALVSANAGIHDWPDLAAGLYTYNSATPLADALRAIIEDATDLQKKAKTARAAAEAFNRKTVDQWLKVIDTYSNS